MVRGMSWLDLGMPVGTMPSPLSVRLAMTIEIPATMNSRRVLDVGLFVLTDARFIVEGEGRPGTYVGAPFS